MSPWMQLSLQDPGSMTMMSLSWFHDMLVLMMILIISVISYMLIFVMSNKLKHRLLKDSHKVELIWTIIPAIILLFMAMPSLRLLYLMDEITNPLMTLKATGHQWYWSYSYSNFNSLEYNSFMTQPENLTQGKMRLLEVDNRIILPMKTEIRLLVTASDVIHSWTIPSLGIKVDAIPGRLNQVSLMINKPGIFYGQCSEICGANHSFMPIVVESINMGSFMTWLNSPSH